ncbi:MULTISPECIES: AtzH-like domain-containing protein [unclassified Nocardioides]|uniref:AtzH-like domain-containing protein n=1 Tax=unclassified Nocardioides TaxID=2615069 RepID=UPI0009F119D1|nr:MULTISPECIES: AtzH-like domain-containing protein [unclassified Nocardioides]GAW50953.1 Amidase [Nocardioides sp. PD653-B2]GAW56320.1 Amidase [Nocardioides sp. PD653]
MSQLPPEKSPPDGLVEAFWEYERALMDNDLPALDRLFAPGPTTLRGDADGLLVGHDLISAFRGTRGGAPARRILQTHVQVVDAEHALVVAVTELERGGRGQQTQLWARTADGWAVTAAHESVPAPALDTRIWRVVGDPLLPPTARGVLDGESVAVKDLYAVAGQRVGAGNPAWLAEAHVEPRSATVVEALLDAGASVRGIARTDEFAYSLAGTNAHTGTPPNPRAPHRISGGSTSGSASAVSLGQATIGLGTDTGGSIRVPASYQGLYGIRTTHGLVSTYGVLPLARSFDAVGWLTRDAALLARVGDVLLPPSAAGPVHDLVTVPGLNALAQPDVAAVVDELAGGATRESWELSALPIWSSAFQVLQAWEAWRERGPWLTTRLDTLGADVRGRFEAAALIDDERAGAAARVVDDAGRRIGELIGDRVLVLPSASSVAPTPGEGLQAVRDATMSLTCLAGLGGLPAVSIPRTTADGLPAGVCLVAASGRDRDLLALAVELSS